MKRFTLALLFILFAPAFFYANGTAESTLTVVVPNTTMTEPLEEIFAAYTAQTGIAVELQVLPSGEDYGRLLQTRFATNDYPDLFEFDPGVKQYRKFGVDNLYDWTDDELFDSVLPATRSFQTYEGSIYGVPWGGTGTYGVFYNKEVFEAIGADLPTNYADFISILQDAKDAGYIPVYSAAKSEWPLQVFSLIGWPGYVDPAIGEEGVNALEHNQLRLNAIPELAQLFERHVELKPYFQDNYQSGTYEEQMELLGTGQVAVCFQISNFVPALVDKFGRDYVEQNIGWFPLPTDDGPGVAMLTPARQLMVPSHGENLAAAVDLVHFMVQAENQQIWFEANPGIPVYAGVETDLYPYEQAALEYANNGLAAVNIQNRLSSSFTDFPKILQNLLISGDIQAALNELDENYRRTGNARALPGFDD